MSEYEPNSHKYKEEQEKRKAEKVEAIAKGVVKKRTATRKFADYFLPDVEDVGNYMITGVIIPNLKKMVWQMFGTMLFGKNNYDNGRYGSPDRVSYTRFFDDERSYRRDRDRSRQSQGARIYHWDDLLYLTPEDAQLVLDRLEDDLRQGYVITVQTLYEYSGQVAPWSADGYGWTSLRSADIVSVGDKWGIKMPRPIPID